MEIKYIDDSDSNCLSSSRNSLNNKLKKNDNLESNRTISTINDIPKKSHEDLRKEKLNELSEELKKNLDNEEFEKGITIMKKLIFFEPNSNDSLICFYIFC